MKVRLLHHQKEWRSGIFFTNLTHVEVLGPAGGFVAFAKITPEVLEAIAKVEIEIPDNLLTWKGKDERQPGSDIRF